MELQERESDLLTLNEQHDTSSRLSNASKIDCGPEDAMMQPLASSTNHNSQNNDKPHVCRMPNSNNTRANDKVFTSRPPNFLALALIVSVCNFPLGCSAVICALLSKRKFQKGDLKGSKGSGQAAKWLSIVGFASFLVLVIFVLIYKFVILPNVIDRINWGDLGTAEDQHSSQHSNETLRYDDIH